MPAPTSGAGYFFNKWRNRWLNRALERIQLTVTYEIYKYETR